MSKDSERLIKLYLGSLLVCVIGIFLTKKWIESIHVGLDGIGEAIFIAVLFRGFEILAFVFGTLLVLKLLSLVNRKAEALSSILCMLFTEYALISIFPNVLEFGFFKNEVFSLISSLFCTGFVILLVLQIRSLLNMIDDRPLIQTRANSDAAEKNSELQSVNTSESIQVPSAPATDQDPDHSGDDAAADEREKV